MTPGAIVLLPCAQRSEAWRQARCGVVTATAAAAVMARGRSGGEAAARAALRTRLVVERLTGRPIDDTRVVTADMARGIQLEPQARVRYAAATGQAVRTVGFVRRTDLAAGCSPDGLVGEDGGVEIKCPRSTTHWRYVRAGGTPPDYRWQIVHSLVVTGARWWEFVSYDPRFPEDMQLVVWRVSAAAAPLAAYERELRRFLAEVDRAVEARRAATTGWLWARRIPNGAAA